MALNCKAVTCTVITTHAVEAGLWYCLWGWMSVPVRGSNEESMDSVCVGSRDTESIVSKKSWTGKVMRVWSQVIAWKSCQGPRHLHFPLILVHEYHPFPASAAAGLHWCWQTVSLSQLWPFQEFCGVQVVGVNSELCLKVQRVPNLHFPSWSQWILMNLVLDCTFPWTASTFISASFSSLWKDALTCQLKKDSAQIRTRWCTAGFRLQLLSLK